MNSIAFNKTSYDNDYDFWKAIADQLRLLVENNYEIAFRYDDCGIYILEFDHDRRLGFGNPTLRWSDED